MAVLTMCWLRLQKKNCWVILMFVVQGVSGRDRNDQLIVRTTGDAGVIHDKGTEIYWTSPAAGDLGLESVTDDPAGQGINLSTTANWQGGHNKTSQERTSHTRSTSLNGYLSREQQVYYSDILMQVKTVIHSVAILTCLLTICSFSRDEVCTSSASFIIALNIFELVTSVLSIVGYILFGALGTLHRCSAVYVLWASTYLTLSCRRAVYIFNMFLAAQRMLMVSAPFLARTSFSHRTNNYVICLIVLLTFGAHTYVFFVYDVTEMGPGQFIMASTPFARDHPDVADGIKNGSIIIFSFLPLVVGLVANVTLIIRLRIHARKSQGLRAGVSSGKGHKSQVTWMILCSTMAFTLLSLPANLNHMVKCFSSHYGRYKRERYLYTVVRDGLYSLLALGDITNFLSYLLLSKAFRENLMTAISPIVMVFSSCLTNLKARTGNQSSSCRSSRHHGNNNNSTSNSNNSSSGTSNSNNTAVTHDDLGSREKF